jgi:hypothetical protein
VRRAEGLLEGGTTYRSPALESEQETSWLAKANLGTTLTIGQQRRSENNHPGDWAMQYMPHLRTSAHRSGRSNTVL